MLLLLTLACTPPDLEPEAVLLMVEAGQSYVHTPHDSEWTEVSAEGGGSMLTHRGAWFADTVRFEATYEVFGATWEVSLLGDEGGSLLRDGLTACEVVFDASNTTFGHHCAD